MNNLAKLISEKTGLDEKMATQVVQVVAEYLQKTLPAPLNTQVEKLLSGQVSDISQIAGVGKTGGGVMGSLGKMFGGGKK